MARTPEDVRRDAMELPILGGIYVIALTHHRRKPGYWRKRVR